MSAEHKNLPLVAIAGALVAVIALSFMLLGLSYKSEENASEQTLVAEASQATLLLQGKDDAQRCDILHEQTPGRTRFTLIDAHGDVLFDSDANSLENHGDRPEAIDAASSGQGVAVRYSQTLHEDAIYAAMRLDDGSIIRLSERRMSFAGFLTTMYPSIIAIFALAILTIVLFLRIRAQQNQLARQNAELKEADSLRREFSSNVSHEMKTPLQVISGYSEMMAGGLVSAEDVPGFSSKIYAESQQLRDLIDDVLTLSKLDESSLVGAKVERMDVLAIASETAERLRPLAIERGVTMRVEGIPAIVDGNRALLAQAIGNLISNAIRYSNDGGKVVVSVNRNGDFAEIAVMDNGIGIAPEEQGKIFERFYRSERSRSRETGGTGLGLAIVKHAALYHGGGVHVQSALSEGSTFTMRVPLAGMRDLPKSA